MPLLCTSPPHQPSADIQIRADFIETAALAYIFLHLLQSTEDKELQRLSNETGLSDKSLALMHTLKSFWL